ncbi:MAG: GntR family transcriptional regulator [Lentisphaeria bacterium]|nr:GntR family transcriptional regulator [Lentisphaeria bacterium]
MKTKKKPHFHIMTEQLAEQIVGGKYHVGDRLPSLRALSQEYGLSEYATHQGLKELQRQGLVVIRHGAGVYVANHLDAQKGSWNICIFVGTEQIGTGYLYCALEGIEEMAMKNDCSITLRKRDYYQYYAPQLPLELVLGNADGVLLLGEYDYLPVTLPPDIPAVGLEMGSFCGGAVSPVTLDPLAAAELAVEYFRSQHKEYVEVHYLKGGPVFQWRAECFCQLWQRYGRFALRPHVLGKFNQAIPEPNPAKGVLFCSGTRCEEYLRAYRLQYGTDLTQKIAVLSMDGKSNLLPDYLPVSNIGIDWHEAGKAAFCELIRRLETPGAEPRRIYLMPHLRTLENITEN